MDQREVEARLHAALGDGLSGHVDVITLIDGARAGAVRVRRRRRVTAGAALLVALAVPAGAAVWSQQDRGPAGVRVAASLPDAPSVSVAPDPTPTKARPHRRPPRSTCRLWPPTRTLWTSRWRCCRRRTSFR